MANYVQSVMDLLNPVEESSLISLSSGIIPTEAIRRMHMTKENLLWVLSFFHSSFGKHEQIHLRPP